MNTRERWLVGLMVGAVVYGGYTYIANARRAQDADVAEDVVSEVRSFAAETRARLNRLQLTREEQAILNLTVADWSASPFYEREPGARPAGEKPKEFHYTGYIHIGAIRLAIINGREYRVNDPVDASDFMVESIDADRVVLAAKGGERRLSLALKESDKTGEKP